jgi:hypothetical protein
MAIEDEPKVQINSMRPMGDLMTPLGSDTQIRSQRPVGSNQPTDGAVYIGGGPIIKPVVSPAKGSGEKKTE